MHCKKEKNIENFVEDTQVKHDKEAECEPVQFLPRICLECISCLNLYQHLRLSFVVKCIIFQR